MTISYVLGCGSAVRQSSGENVRPEPPANAITSHFCSSNRDLGYGNSAYGMHAYHAVARIACTRRHPLTHITPAVRVCAIAVGADDRSAYRSRVDSGNGDIPLRPEDVTTRKSCAIRLRTA